MVTMREMRLVVRLVLFIELSCTKEASKIKAARLSEWKKVNRGEGRRDREKEIERRRRREAHFRNLSSIFNIRSCIEREKDGERIA